MPPPFDSATKELTTRDPLDPLGDEKDTAQARMLRLLKSRLNGQREDVLAALGDPPDLANLTSEFWRTQAGLSVADLRPEIEAMVLRGASAASATVPILWDEAVIAREAVDWATQYVYDLVTGLDANTLAVLQRVIPRFAETPGMTIGDLRRELAPVFGESRAQVIAVTETTRAFAEGQRIIQAELSRGGVRMLRKWNTAGDEKRVCELCMDLDGKTEDEWSGIDGPPRHPSCRCWTTLVVAP